MAPRTCMLGPRPCRLFLMVILVLTPLTQSFWFAQAWHVIDAVAWLGLRMLLHGLWIVAALVVLAAVLDMLQGRLLPRLACGPWGLGAAPLLVVCFVFQFLGGDGGGESGVVLAAGDGSPATGAVGAWRAGASHYL